MNSAAIALKVPTVRLPSLLALRILSKLNLARSFLHQLRACAG